MFARFSNNLRPMIQRMWLIRAREESTFSDPPYLEELKPKVPVHEVINFQIKGYDFPILEKYQSFLHKAANKMSLDVEDCWATPPKHMEVTKCQPKTTNVDSTYNLCIYERNVQICNIEAHLYPIFLRLIQAALPEGVTLNVNKHEAEAEEIRIVPDTDLKKLETELDELAVPGYKRIGGHIIKQKTRYVRKVVRPLLPMEPDQKKDPIKDYLI